MNEEMVKILNYLRMPYLCEKWDEYITLARKKRFSASHLLKHVLEEEYKIKQINARERRMQQAKIPEHLVMETYPFKRQPKLNKKKILSLYDAFEYVEKSQNIIWVGPTGCGKTGLATSFLIQAIQKGHTGRHVLFPELVGELYSAVADHSEEKIIKRYAAYDNLLIDEVGYIEIEPVGAGLFFTLMHKRHKRKSTLITSNLGFKEWKTFFKNPHLTAALIDRLTENSHVFNMKDCDSLRNPEQEKNL